MGITKSNLFTEEQNRIAQFAKAIAHPARVAILQHLIERGSCVCGDIVSELPLSQSTISQHLKELKASGIIKGSIDGSYSCYCLDSNCCEALKQNIIKLFSSMKNCC